MNRLINIDNLPEVFGVRDVIRLSNSKVTRRMLNYEITKLLKGKKLIKIKNGVYSKIGDIFYIASYLYDGYIGFSSALYLHGLKEEIEASVYVCTSSPKKRLRVMERVIEPVNMSKQQYGVMAFVLNGREILISTYAKTIFDMLSKPKYANYFDMYRAMKIRSFSKGQWEELAYYAKNSNITDIRRVGYATEGIAPGWFTGQMNDLSRKGYRTSFFFKHKAENYNLKWSMFDGLSVRRWLNAVRSRFR